MMAFAVSCPLPTPAAWPAGGFRSLFAVSSRAAKPDKYTLVDRQPLAFESDEQELSLRARSGDREALGTLLRRHGPRLYRSVLLPRLGSTHAAEEALSTTYLRVVERIGQFNWQAVGIYPWLRVVALRVALDQLRARKREVLFEPVDLEREIEQAERDARDAEAIEQHDLRVARQRVLALLGRIHPRYAAAIRLRVLEERSREEAARELEVSVATFDVVLHRALAALRKAMAAASEDA
jgi:RNA polymerase sigma-70 factor (ECF subfamily)